LHGTCLGVADGVGILAAVNLQALLEEWAACAIQVFHAFQARQLKQDAPVASLRRKDKSPQILGNSRAYGAGMILATGQKNE
jgi:hypothetical protein